MRKGHFAAIVFASIVIYLALNPGKESAPVEQLDIPSGLGIDVEENSQGNIVYSIPTSFYVFTPQGKTLTKLHVGKGITIGETREDRQLEENNKFVLGLEKILIMSEDASRFGVRKIIDVLSRNYQINDNAETVISEQRAEEVLGMKIEGYASSADYIEGMIKNAYQQNFFADNYKLIDMYVMMDAEGRNLVLPYLDIRAGKPVISSMALFDKDKMVRKIDIEEAKVMNIMREKKVRGMLFLKEDINKNIDFAGKTERKVSCHRVGDKYYFNIEVKISGDIVTNSMYEDMEKDPETMKKFENDMAEDVKKKCYQFIEKMQKEYKLDCLELGEAAAAKYGRDTGMDWNEAVSNADIKVNIKVAVDKVGVGEY